MSHPADNAVATFLSLLPAGEVIAWKPTHANDQKVRLTREPFRDGTVVTASVGPRGVTLRKAGSPSGTNGRRKMAFTETDGAVTAVGRLRSVHDGLVHIR